MSKSPPRVAGQPDMVCVNGRLVGRDKATVSAFDYGFLYGFGLFETLRAYHGVAYRLDEHVHRLLAGAARLGFADNLRPGHLEKACDEVIRANGLTSARLRLTVTPGNGDGMPDPQTCTSPTVIATARPYEPPATEAYERGFAAVVSLSRRCPLSSVAELKTLSRAEHILARAEARRQGADETLFMSEWGLLLEGTVSNVFLVSGGNLVTPSLQGILPGIARTQVLSIARTLGIPLEERNVPYQELLSANEAFLTNSMIEIMPLTSIGGKPVGNGRPGSLTQRFAAAYRADVEKATSQGRLDLA